MTQGNSLVRPALILLLAVFAVACQPDEVKQVDLVTDVQKASYMLGFAEAQQMTDQTAGALDLEAFAQGVADKASGTAAQVDETQMETLLGSLREAVRERQAQAGAAAVDEGNAFREEFAALPEVRATESGLLYKVITPGDGLQPRATDTVVVHYEGRLIDGTVFDSSRQRGQPAEFALNRVIAGWTEGLQLMSEGAEWHLVIPPELAYGERGAGEMIGPNATLQFKVELLEVKNDASADEEGEPDA